MHPTPPKRILDLHNHPRCTEFIHDFLDLIQQRMLLVQSDDPPIHRIRAHELVAEMAKIRDRCHAKATCCLAPCRQDKARQLHPQVPVEAPLSPESLSYIGKHSAGKMKAFDGRIRSVRPQVLN